MIKPFAKLALLILVSVNAYNASKILGFVDFTNVSSFWDIGIEGIAYLTASATAVVYAARILTMPYES